MNYIIIAALTLETILGIDSCKGKVANEKIQAVEVRNISPLMGETFYRVYYAGDYHLYYNQYIFDSIEKQYNIDSTTDESSIEVTHQSRHMQGYYFVFHKDSSYGFMYDSSGRYNNKRLKIDSTIKIITGTNRYEVILQRKPDSIIWNSDRTNLKEVYVNAAINEQPSSQWNFYYSCSLNHIKHSFNKILDSSKGMKLYKTEFIFEGFYSEKDKTQWPSMISATEMKEITVENRKQIQNYIKQ